MKDIYITKNGTLKRNKNSLLFVNKEDNMRIPVREVNAIYFLGEITINTKLLNFLSKLNIPIFYFNYFGFYSGCICPVNRNISGKLLVEQVKVYLDIKKRIGLAKKFLLGAFHNMRKTLMQYRLDKALNYFDSRIQDLKCISSINKLLLFEANVRQYYYKQFNRIVSNDQFKFIQRTRNPPDNYINTLISFGNSLLYTTILAEIFKTQLDPRIAYLHEPFERRYSLNLDISEIFKPLIVDRVIFTLINKKMINESHFDKNLNFCYLNTEGRKIFLREYDNKLKTTLKYPSLNRTVSYRYMLRLEAYKLIKFFLESVEYKPFKIYW